MNEDMKAKNVLMKMLYIDELSANEIAARAGGKVPGIKSPCSVQNIRYHIYTKYNLKKPGRAWKSIDTLNVTQSLKDLSCGKSFREDCEKVAMATERKLSDVMSRCESSWKEMYGTIKSIDSILPCVESVEAEDETKNDDVNVFAPSAVTFSVGEDVKINLDRGANLENDQVLTLQVMPIGQREVNGSVTPMELPDYQTDGAAALDLCAAEYASIRPGATSVVRTGIVVKIPEGYAGLVLPRSGLAAKKGITVLNSPGLIDSDYCGEEDEVKVILINLSTGPKASTVEIKPGERIAQLLLVPAPRVSVVASPMAFRESSRGGLGSTGV